MAAKREQDFIWEGIDRGELLVQKCSGCGTLRHPPLPRCGHCGCADWEGARMSGRGTILSWIWIKHPSGEDPNPRVGVLVELEEGPRLVSNLIDTENATIGAPVAVEFATFGDDKVALFRTTAPRA